MKKHTLHLLTAIAMGFTNQHIYCPTTLNITNFESTAHFRTKYDELVELTKLAKQDPFLSPQTKIMYSHTFAENTPYANILKQFLNTDGPKTPSEQLFLEIDQPVIQEFFEHLFSSETLTMIAYMQNKYGNGNAYTYDSSLFIPSSKTDLARINPVILEPNFTSYRLLNHSIAVIDQVVREHEKQKTLTSTTKGDRFLNALNRLNIGLDQAIAQQAKIIMNQKSIEFDAIVNSLRDQMQKNTWQKATQIVQDLTAVSSKYKK